MISLNGVHVKIQFVPCTAHAAFFTDTNLRQYVNGSKVSNVSVFRCEKSDTIRGLGSGSFKLAMGQPSV